MSLFLWIALRLLLTGENSPLSAKQAKERELARRGAPVEILLLVHRRLPPEMTVSVATTRSDRWERSFGAVDWNGTGNDH